MSKNRDLERRCIKKHRYSKMGEAWVAVRRTIEEGRGRTHGRPLQPYYCEECEGWHIGHAPKKRVREGTRAYDLRKFQNPNPDAETAARYWINEWAWRMWQKMSGTYHVRENETP